MLDFSFFFIKDNSWTFERDSRSSEPDSYTLHYLKTILNHKKLFRMEDSFYGELLSFLSLQKAKNYAKRHYDKILPKKAENKKESASFSSWKSLHKLLTITQWNSMLKYLFDDKAAPEEKLLNAIFGKLRKTNVFEKRLHLLCETLGLCNINKEVLRLLHLNDYNASINDLFENVTKAINSSRHKISYPAIGVLINVSEETVLEALSKERGLTSLNVLNSTERGFGIPLEIRKYLKGLGSDNFMDIYAASDKKPTLPLEKFDYQREAKYVTDLISMHKNDKPLHILLYGVEGTGKTELARTIAANANCEILDVGRGIKKHTLEAEENVNSALIKFRTRALIIAEIALRNKSNLMLLIDEADQILNGFEKGALNQILEEMRLPIIWISNSLLFVENSSLRRFNFSLKFKANNENMRLKIWESVIEKHQASEIFSTERIKSLAQRYDANPGGIELAVSSEMQFAKNGKQEQVAELVLKQHLELLCTESNHKNTLSRAPKYDESVLNVHGLENALHAAKCYAEYLKNKETDSNCTMLLYGPPGTGKTEFAKHLARISGLAFKEISYGKISSMWVGQTEKKIATAFEEASKEATLLFIDEADSLISDRRGANHSWETTQVNEFLIQLENSKCLVVCSTNFQGKLDAASNRRFHFHLKFDYLKNDGILKMAQNFFPEFEQESWNKLCSLECLTPGDFYAVYKRLQWLPRNELSATLVTHELNDVACAKEPYGNRRMGF
ncbi:MAG: ATP-binding protein [Fibromonadaceae bacterium]|nr:ATP-binding protein [Fibromonadaceae bacterium]